MTAIREDFRAQLAVPFSQLSDNSELVECAMEMLGKWMSAPEAAHMRQAILAHIEQQQYSLLLDSFYQLIPFGTGGRRGRVGYGPNRINDVTVAESVQGHCNYLKAKNISSGDIVVAFDTRIFDDISQAYRFLGPAHPLLGLTSKALARIAAEIYAGNGFRVFMFLPTKPVRYLSTPELSFAIRRVAAIGGINISASHNHPDDNGFKFYNPQGAQDVPPVDQELTSFMQDVGEVKRHEIEGAISKGLIRDIANDVHSAYLSLNLGIPGGRKRGGIRVVYTPLCGTGDTTVGDVLRSAGYDVQSYGPQSNYDGTFASVPFRLPNPEVPESASPALPWATEQGAHLVLSTDPDADRIGVFARNRDNTWRYFTGNEIASTLAYYMLLDHERGPKRSGFLIKTLVTTRMLESIAAKSGCQIIPDLLVGFKYVANVLYSLESTGRFRHLQARPEDLVLAAEESHGVLLTPEIRDKDAAGGALMLCDLVSALSHEGNYLPEYYDALANECGNYQNVARSIVMRGIRGIELLSQMMRSLREDPPRTILALPVLGLVDRLSRDFGPLRSDTDRESRNLLVFSLNGAQVVIRPSGTEPKAKVYVDCEDVSHSGGRDRGELARAAHRLAAEVVALCTRRVGISLSESADLLPDYIDLDLKADFDRRFKHDLLGFADSINPMDDRARLSWLRERLAPYAAGADPIQATCSAVDRLCDEIYRETVSPEVQRGVRELQRAIAEARVCRSS